jgi:uncharacterized protein
MKTWSNFFPEILTQIHNKEFFVPPGIILGTDAFLIPSPDKKDLHFTFPLQIISGLFQEYSLPVTSSAGAIHAIIAHCKKEAKNKQDLGILYGSTTSNQSRYDVNIEPCTVALSKASIATNLWHPDNFNNFNRDGIRLVIRGAIPFLPPIKENLTVISSIIQRYTESLVECVLKTPNNQIIRSWEAVYDQQEIRASLSEQNLVCVIGDGTRPARSYTRHRCWYRVAGPKEGVHIPFYCPKELDPVEISLKGTNKTITGLGIKKGEIFAITGSNAEGKSTLLQAIIAGEDDHAPGDGRELMVTDFGGIGIDATNIELRGADLSPFFSKIPPGMSGNPESAFGQGSGSASMAHQFNEALRKRSPYIIIDEDRSAINLLIPCFMSSPAINSLASLIKTDRNWLSKTSIIIAGSGVELVIAQADRILKLSEHRSEAISPVTYRNGLKKYYSSISNLITVNDQDDL